MYTPRQHFTDIEVARPKRAQVDTWSIPSTMNASPAMTASKSTSVATSDVRSIFARLAKS